jgi:uncharacterized protein YjiK
VLYERNGYQFPYQVEKPDKYWELPKKLVEISGLGYIDNTRLALVQDEKGIVFIFNVQSGRVEREIKFGGDGDYEGIEIVENDAWILESNGNLYRVKDFLAGTDPHVEKYSTALSAKNDTEGLAYDHANKNLLIACKGHTFVDHKKGKDFKSIFNFNIETKKLNPEPVLLIELDSIKKYKNYNTITQWGVNLLAYLDNYKGDVTFQPSGVAIHPISGNMYVLGSVGKMLIVYSRACELMAMVELNPKTYAQPEGICFDPNGTLYISNEGDGNKANIVMMKMMNK